MAAKKCEKCGVFLQSDKEIRFHKCESPTSACSRFGKAIYRHITSRSDGWPAKRARTIFTPTDETGH
jgi:hypothetical protein